MAVEEVDRLLGSWTARDLFEKLGPIPLYRLQPDPAPGSAVEQDVVEVREHQDWICELADGTLIRKTGWFYDSHLAASLGADLSASTDHKRLGIVLGPDGAYRLGPGLIRIPDVSFVSRDRLPGGRVPHVDFLDSGPDLAVEIINAHNTDQEMQRKLREYFAAGVRLVWYIYPDRLEAHVYTSPDQFTVVGEDGALEGGDVVPGFRLDLRILFAEPGEDLPL